MLSGPRSLPALRGAGVLVCLAGTVHAADDVTKTHASALDTFQSLNDGAARDGRPGGRDDPARARPAPPRPDRSRARRTSDS